MSDFFSTAFIRLKPDPRGFREQLRQDVQRSIGAGFNVPITPKLAAFKQRLQAELRTANLTVPVQPVVTAAARRNLQTQLAAQIGPISLPVARAAAAPSAAGPQQLATAQEELAATGLTAAQAEAVLNKELARGALILPQVTAATNVASAAREKTTAAAGAEATAAREAAAAERLRIRQQQLATDAAILAADAEAALASAQTAGALKTTQLAADRAVLTASTQAAGLASRAYREALISEDQTTILTARALTERAAAQVAAAESAVRDTIALNANAKAAQAAAVSHELAARGFGATGLAALGARGATLAASGEFLVGAAAATAFFKAVSSAASLETELNVFQETAGATADEMERVATAAQDLGRDITLPAVGAGDAAQAMTDLAKAGLSVQDSLDGARGVLQLATAAEIDNAQATEIVASGLNAFGLAGIEAVRVADLLTGSAIESQGSITDMGIALQQSAAAARQAGFSIEDTIALLTLLARNGLRGSDAGTSLRTALIRLINPTEKAAGALDNLNLRIRDSQGRIRPEVFADLGTALSDLTAKQRDATLAIIFGQDAFRSAAIFAREGAAGLDAMRDATQQQGLTTQLASARTRGFAGDIEALKNAAETLGVEFGTAVIPALELLVDTSTDAIGAILDLTAAFDDLEASLPGQKGGGGSGIEGFFRDIVGDITDTNIFESFEELAAAAALLQKGEFAEFGKAPSQTIRDLNNEIVNTTQNAEGLASTFGDLASETAKFGKGPVGPQVEFLRNLREELIGAGPEAEKARKQIDDLIRLLVALGRAPTELELKVFFDKGVISSELRTIEGLIAQTPIEFDLTLDERAAKQAATRAADDAVNAFKNTFEQAPPVIFDFLLSGAGAAGEKAGAAAAASFTAGLESQFFAAEAQGDIQRQLAIRRQQLARARARLERQQRAQQEALKKGQPGTGLQAAIDATNQQITQLQGDIDRLVGDIESSAEEARNKIINARNEADRKFLDALGVDRRKKENAVLRAASTAGLADDIKAQRQLRDSIKRAITESQETLKDAQTRAETVGSLTSDLIQANQRLDDLNRQLQDSLQQRFEIQVDIARATGNVTRLRKLFAERIRQLKAALADAQKGSLLALQLRDEILKTQAEAFDAINESFELDIGFAQATKNRAKEIRAREAFIKQLQREQAQYKKGTLEWKRLRNEIAEQRQAVADARGERENLFSELAFEFLTTQQGFTANLLGNLLPSGAIGNTVAGKLAGGGEGTAAGGGVGTVPIPSPLPGEGRQGPRGPIGFGPRAAVQESQRISQATAAGGFTAAQAATLIALTERMVGLLSHIDNKGKHPEARRQQRASGGTMDVM